MNMQAQQLSGSDFVGTWYDADTNRVEIREMHNQYLGKIVELHKLIDPDTQKPLLDKHNPIDSLRTRPVEGIIFLKGAKFANDSLKHGDMYNYQNGKSFKTYIIFTDKIKKDSLKVMDSGNKTTHWTKKKPGS